MGDPSNPSISAGAAVRTDCCYMCGFAGRDKSLIACKMCNCCIHIYCYNSFCTGAPNRTDQDEWVCEYCQPPNITCSSKPAASKFTTGSVKFKRPVRSISEDEAIARGVGSSTPEGRGPPTPPGKPCVRVKETEINTEDNSHSPSSIDPPEPAPEVLTSSPIPASSLGLDHNVEKHVHVEVPISLTEPSPELKSCKEHIDSRAVVAQGTNFVEQSLEDAQVRIDGCLPNPPFQQAAWKGSFTITASGFGALADSCDRIWGYLPMKTSMKAFEFSKKMPDFLHFDAVRRDIIWANLFAEEGPDKDDIGLYFLPPDIKSGQCYCCLVSLLEKFDVVIRCLINGVQLLVFTSKHLDDKSQKINGTHYLWGLFVPPDVVFKEPPQVRGKKVMEDGINAALHNAESQQMLSVQVKVEQFDGIDLAPPPGFAPLPELAVPPAGPELAVPPAGPELAAPPGGPELAAPPGFAGVNRRVKFRSIGDLLRDSD